MNCTINMAPCLEKLKLHKKQILKFLFFISGVAFFLEQSLQTFTTFFDARKSFSLSRETIEFVEPPTMMFCPKNYWDQIQEMRVFTEKTER